MNRVAIGYDIHRFSSGRKLVLGGVEIPFKKGLLGHSDADIVIHAVCDSILGAMGGKDIGELFPNTDPKYKNILSLKLLEQVVAYALKAKFAVVNVSIVILMEAPKIAPYKDAMKKNIAKILKIDKDCVGISATTHEGVGDIGKGKAAAAYAVVLLKNNKV